MSFRNPILAGTTLVRTAIESANYVPGSAGWMIGRDGTAEFNGATFRGTVVVQSNEAILIYSGAPAAGNLVMAIAPIAGTDAYGNTYAEGLSVVSGFTSLVAGLTGGSPLIYGVTGNANITNSGALQATTQGSGNGEYDIWQVLGPKDSTQKDFATLQLVSSSADGTQSAHLALIYTDAAGTAHPWLTIGPSVITATTQLAISRATNSSAVNATYSAANGTNAAYAYNGFDATGRFFAAQVISDTIARFIADVNGTLGWGSGTASRDVTLGRSAAGILALSAGSLAVTTAGQGLRVKEGTNAKQGVATLASGTVTVANTSVTASSRILLSTQSPSGTVGHPYISARVAGTSFTISSTSAADNSTVAYQIFEPG